MKPFDKLKSIIPNGIPRYIRCYDNEGYSFDRYTIVFTKRKTQHPIKSRREWMYLTASMFPFHPQGFGQHGFSAELIDRPSYSQLGKRKKFEDMPTDVQRFILQEYFDHWDLEPIYAKYFTPEVIISPLYGTPAGREQVKDDMGKYDFRIRLLKDQDGCDAGGAYWGTGSYLYVQFKADLTKYEYVRDEK